MTNSLLDLTRIVQEVALTESPAEQVRLMVDSISRALDIDVCTLYRCNEQGDMVMLASHGLDQANAIVIPAGKGLVGRVAQCRHVLNVADAAVHPDFFYVAATHEERYRSFCGAPLVRFGEVIGVLVVQSAEPEKLHEQDEAFLATLAAQLALIVSGIPAQATGSLLNQRTYGIKSAPGIGIGKARICDQGELFDIHDAPCSDIEFSIEQWHHLLAHVVSEIDAEQEALGLESSDTIRSIFDAYRMLLSDQALIERVEHEIRSGHWLPYALRLAIQYFADFFKSMDDPYLKARQEDIQHLGTKLFNVWRGEQSLLARPDDDASPVVLIGTQVSVSDIASVPVIGLPVWCVMKAHACRTPPFWLMPSVCLP